ncbi:hypothetical protein ROZALSC1DRAFT_31198, partial [Rozella allomycis CSF55]
SEPVIIDTGSRFVKDIELKSESISVKICHRDSEIVLCEFEASIPFEEILEIERDAIGYLCVKFFDEMASAGSPDLDDSAETLSVMNSTDIAAVIYFEIIEAKNLPREKSFIKIGYDSDPFVVISFGKQTYKTRFIRHTLNPVWNEKVYIPVGPNEMNFDVNFAVYDHDKFSTHDYIGKADLNIKDLPKNAWKEFILPLQLKRKDIKDPSFMVVKGSVWAYADLKIRFWTILSGIYDHDENGKLNRIELISMLESIGSTLSEETIEDLFSKFGKEEDAEVQVEDIVDCLDNISISGSMKNGDSENLVLLKKCPTCGKKMKKFVKDFDIINHLVICSNQNDLNESVGRFVMSGFLTEEHASRKWFMSIFKTISFGSVKLGNNNGNILVQDRKTGRLLEEKMPTYIRLGIRLMHQKAPYNITSRLKMVKMLLKRLTIQQGKKFDDPSSVKSIEPFIKYHNLNVEEILDPIESFKSFNEFFYRKIKPSSRKLASSDPKILVSAADSRTLVFPSISTAVDIWIKGSKFSVSELLEEANHPFLEGSLVIHRLAPQDYHRFHSPVDGKIPGDYFTVNPMAIRQKSVNVYTENVRNVIYIESEAFGLVAIVAVGAMMVGSIVWTVEIDQSVNRMDELGYFKFGGSTLVILLQQNTVSFDNDLIENSQRPLETLLAVGDSVGTSCK